MKRISIILTALLLFSFSLIAQQRSADEAAAIAASFVNGQPQLRKAHRAAQSASSMRLAHTRQKAQSNDNAFYVFNRADNAGAVIVSADERTNEAVLGYTDSGSFDPEHVNPNMQFWLNRYAEQISALSDADAEAAPVIRTVSAIAPLLGNTTWDQLTPYNNLCPVTTLDNDHAYTGCVATATAQIMRKWRHPAQGTGSSSYQWEDCSRYSSRTQECTQTTKKTLSANYGTTTYDWDNILDSYASKSYTTAQANAVATLMYHCGVAAEMAYGGETVGGSGAWTDAMGHGLVNYFGYQLDKFITTYSFADYYQSISYTYDDVPYECNVTTTQFINYFNQDLEAGRPILMGGESDASGGHEFVCDGRDANGKFHINWGWEGDCNGYFALTALKPTGTTYNFSSNLDALIGLRPVVTDPVAVTGVTLTPSSATVNINGKVQLTATILPADATNKNVSWSSDNTSIATVTTNGLVQGVSAGTVTVSVVTADGAYTANTTITVTSTVEENADFEQLTDLSNMTTGDEVIIVCTSKKVAAANMSNSVLQPSDVTITNGKIALDDDSPVTIFTVGVSGGNYTFAKADGSLLGATAVKKLGWDKGNTQWEVSVSGGDAVIQNSLTSYGRFLYNANSPRFTTYTSNASASMIVPQLYIRKAKVTPGPTTALDNADMAAPAAQKVLRDGQVLILRDGILYNLMGQTIE